MDARSAAAAADGGAAAATDDSASAAPGAEVAALPPDGHFAPAAVRQPVVDLDHDLRLARRLERLSAPAIALPLILAIGSLLFIVNLGGYPLYTKGEPREAVTIFDIVHGGGVILPLRAGVEIPSKPLLMHWLAALVSLLLGGVSEWSVRLPSAILAIAGMIACYLYLRRLFEARGALIAALMLGTSFQYLQAGTGSRVDMTLTFCLTIAFFEFLMFAEGLRETTLPLYFAIAAAVLTKGPIGLMLPALVAAVWIVLTRRWSLLRRLSLGRGAVIVGVLGGGWYLAAIATGGMAFIHKQILAENLYRLTNHVGFRGGHEHPFYYIEGALLAGFMPWTPLALVALVQALRRPRRLDARFGYLLVWFLAVLIFYNLPASKRGVYLLALYPALAALIALFLSDAITHHRPAIRWVRAIAVVAGLVLVAVGGAALIALGLLALAPGVIGWTFARFGIMAAGLPPALRAAAHQWLVPALLLPPLVAAAGFYLLRARPRADKLFGGLLAGFAGIALAVNLVVEPAIARTLTLKYFTATALEVAGNHPLGYFGTIDYDFAFYSGRNVRFVSAEEADPPPFIVCPDNYYRLMPPTMRARYAVVLRSGPTDLDGSGAMMLLARRDLAAPPPAAPAHSPTPAAGRAV